MSDLTNNDTPPGLEPDTVAAAECVTSADALRFLEEALRNWPRIPAISQDDLHDVAGALTRFVSERAGRTVEQPDFQQRVDVWMDACFGTTIKADLTERADRFIEEALELAQTVDGWTSDRAHALVNYVFGRPVGERAQEVGGVMVTLAALCNAAGLSTTISAETELARVWTKVEAIRAKQAAKPTGSALPIAVLSAQLEIDAELVKALEACRAQFDFYAAEHRKAGKHDKAATNEKFAFLCSEAIAKALAA